MLPERSTSRIYRYAHRWRSRIPNLFPEKIDPSFEEPPWPTKIRRTTTRHSPLKNVYSWFGRLPLLLGDSKNRMEFNNDFRDMLVALNDANVEYMVVGARTVFPEQRETWMYG